MILRFGLFFALMLTWSCSGDDAQQPTEPVAAEQKVPDQPGGDAGEGQAKPAGEGQAAADQAAPAADAEKSQPNTDAAAAAKPEAAPAAAGDMVVKAGALNVRSGPGMKNAVVRTLKKGEHVSPTSCDKGWCKLADNEFVSKKYLSAAK